MENDFEQKLGAILSNPEMMQKIQAMAGALGQSAPAPAPAPAPEQKPPEFDPRMLQAITGLAGQTGIDQNQQNLLCALSPYMSRNKVTKLENAMKAAKLARLASSFLGNGGLQLFTGR